MIRTAILFPIGFSLMAAVSSPAGFTYATDVPSARSVRSVPVGVKLDECQECNVIVQPSMVVPGYFQAHWDVIENEDGLCPPGADYCVRCSYPCGNDGDTEAFADSLNGWQWISTETDCPDDCSASREEQLANVTMQVRHAASEDIARLIMASDGELWINEQRGAIQAIGCREKLGLHIPISASLMDAITDRLDSLAYHQRN